MLPKLFFILGQTATGKTARAVTLAKSKGGELINCDSRQIYRGLDIITGKTDNPTDIPVHMVDVVSPDESFSAFDFAQKSIISIQEIVARGKMPIVVGGTGNYARMLKYLDPTKPKLHHAEYISRSSLDLEKLTKGELQKMLLEINRQIFTQLNPSDKENPRRLIRAIQRSESYIGEVLDLDSPHALANQYKVRVIMLLHKDQESLRARISQRVDERLSSGAVEECTSLLAKGYKPADPGLATIGYQSIFRHVAGIIDYETMKTEWATKEHQYAKRQKTYLLKYFPEAEIILV